MTKIGLILSMSLMICSQFSSADPSSTCSVSRQDLMIARARLACQMTTDLPTCANALMVSGFMRPAGLKARISNQDLQYQVALADQADAGVIEIALADWAGERAQLLQPLLATESLKAFIMGLPPISDATTQTDRASRNGLQALANSATEAWIPIESVVFWLRNISYPSKNLSIILDSKLTAEQQDILRVLLSNQGQSADLKSRIKLLKADAESLKGSLFTRTALTTIGAGVLSLTRRALKGDIEHIVEKYGHSTLQDVGIDFVKRFSIATLKVAQSNAVTLPLVAPLMSFGQSAVVRSIGLKGLAFLVGSFQPPGLLFATLEMTFKINPVACATVSDMMLPLDTSCRLNRVDSENRNVLLFLDTALEKSKAEPGWAETYLKYPRTCEYYEGLALEARQDATIDNVVCHSTKVNAQFAVRGKKYSLEVLRFPLDSRNPGGIRQIVATAADRYSSVSNIAANFVYHTDGEQDSSMNGFDKETGAATRIAALRAMSACRRQN